MDEGFIFKVTVSFFIGGGGIATILVFRGVYRTWQEGRDQVNEVVSHYSQQDNVDEIDVSSKPIKKKKD